jgi:hypothetical protein
MVVALAAEYPTPSYPETAYPKSSYPAYSKSYDYVTLLISKFAVSF